MRHQINKPNYSFTEKFLTSVLSVLLLLLNIQIAQVLFGVNRVNAEEMSSSEAVPLTASVEGYRSDLSMIEKQKVGKENITLPRVNLSLNDQTAKVRGDVLANATNSVNAFSYREFSIYEGYAALYDDLDEDGYYQTFNVVFDADVFGQFVDERAVVYADLYLSRNGGPWVHYFSTEAFDIYGESVDDTYEVLTTLYEGYESDYYEVLIDLYEVGGDGIVATFSSADTDALYGLPLESSDYDTYFEEEYYYHEEHGGSLSILAMLLIAMVLTRKINNRVRH